MNRNEYLWYSSEINTLETLLKGIPEENVIELLGYESRLKEAREAIAGIAAPVSQTLKLTFRGQPVVESHGIYAAFAGQALEKFMSSITAIIAGLKGKLSNMGPIPEKQQNQLLIVGSAVGSCGFELELPASTDNKLFEDHEAAGESVKKIQAIFSAITDGTDEELSELIEEVHPRAIEKVRDFLDFQIQNEAWCGLDFGGHAFRFHDVEQVRNATPRLAKDNIIERTEILEGSLLGVLPQERKFELEIQEGEVKKGRTELTIDEGRSLLEKYFNKNIKMTLKVLQVGRGNPRYILESLENVVFTGWPTE